MTPALIDRGQALTKVYFERAGEMPVPGGPHAANWVLLLVSALAFGLEGVPTAGLEIDSAEAYALATVERMLVQAGLSELVGGYHRAIRAAAELLRGSRDMADDLMLSGKPAGGA